MYFQVFALLVLASTMCSAEPVLDTPAARPSAIESIVKQLELVTGNLNVLHTVLGEMAHEYDTLQAPAVKSDRQYHVCHFKHQIFFANCWNF